MGANGNGGVKQRVMEDGCFPNGGQLILIVGENFARRVFGESIRSLFFI